MKRLKVKRKAYSGLETKVVAVVNESALLAGSPQIQPVVAVGEVSQLYHLTLMMKIPRLQVLKSLVHGICGRIKSLMASEKEELYEPKEMKVI